MADALNPWLLSYMTIVAETYGAQLDTVPLYDKKKKVQIIEFLTYGSDEEPTYVWGRVAEKEYHIPVKFSKEAVVKFESLNGSRLTQYKGGIVTLTKFRPMFSRLPNSQGAKSSPSSHLALECGSVSLLGSVGESTFGSPKPITSHPDMIVWSQGLNEPGGAGNVLKQRKQEAESHNKTSRSLMRQSLMPPPAPPGPQDTVQVKKNASPPKTIEVVDLETYRARWQIVEKNPAYRHPPWQNEDVFDSKDDDDNKAGFSLGITEEAIVPKQTDNIRDLSATQDVTPPPRQLDTNCKLQSVDSEIEHSEAWKSRSATPLSTWGESSPGSKASADDQIEATNNSTSVVLPTPAQRVKRPINTNDFPPSSYRNESIADIEPDISSSQVVSAIQRQPVAVVPRRVPRPTSPQPRRTTGPERVLVPNSDTSGTQSQSLTQSQFQSQLQHHLPVQTEVLSSRRTGELKNTDMDIDETNVKKVRKRSSFRAKSASYSPRGVRSTPATNWVDDNDQALSESSSRGSDDEEADDGWYEDEADEKSKQSEEEDYPWMSMRSAREMLAKAEAHRKSRLANVVIT